ncbi:GNAT family N-acetyltransferase [Candidatus Omnitrophota bacterium]
MQIRSFEPKDAAGVKALISSIMNKEFVSEEKAYQYGDLDNIEEAYGKLREKFLVVEEDGEIIGTAGIKEDSEKAALLRRLFVHPSHRGRGIGHMLVDTAMDFCKMNDYNSIVFRATNNMAAATSLLTHKKGFIEDSRMEFDSVEIVMLHYTVH